MFVYQNSNNQLKRLSVFSLYYVLCSLFLSVDALRALRPTMGMWGGGVDWGNTHKRRHISATNGISTEKTTVSTPTHVSPSKSTASAKATKGQVSSEPIKVSQKISKDTDGIANLSERRMGARSPDLVVHKDMDGRETAALMQEILQRLNSAESEIRLVKRKAESGGIEFEKGVASGPRRFIIDRKATTVGAAVAGGVIGLVLGWSVLVNLWLVGAVLGAAACSFISTLDTDLGDVCKNMGKQVALVYKDAKDLYDQTIFMYKTGRLSYKYWSIWDDFDSTYKVTRKYESLLATISANARELDNQYRLRNKVIGWWGNSAKSVKNISLAAVGGSANLLKSITGFGETVMNDWDDEYGRARRNRSVWGTTKKRKRRPGQWSPYSAPLNDNSYGKPIPKGWRGAFRRMTMSKEQKLAERLKGERVGFLGRRLSDKD